MFVIGIVRFFIFKSQIIQTNPFYSYGIVLLALSGIQIPFAVLKLKYLCGRIVDKTSDTRVEIFFHSPFYFPILISFWCLLLFSGYSIAGAGIISSLITPLLTLLAIVAPILIFISILCRDCSFINYSRGWGALSVGLIAAPILGNILEIGIIVIALVVLLLFLIQNPLAMADLESLVIRLSNAQANPQILNNISSAFIRQPFNKLLVLAFVSGLVPIIEETIKQTPMWLLAWRKISPRAGLMVGALSGVGFAIAESLLTVIVANDPDQWVFQIMGRTGTNLMHITTAAIGGWGLAAAFGGKGYIKWLWAYLITIILHGVWNILVTWISIDRLINPYSSRLSADIPLTPGVLLGGVLLVMVLFSILNKNILKD